MRLISISNGYVQYINDDGESEFHPVPDPQIETDHKSRRNVAISGLIFLLAFWGALICYMLT